MATVAKAVAESDVDVKLDFISYTFEKVINHPMILGKHQRGAIMWFDLWVYLFRMHCTVHN